ncbi:unnamed protein product [Aureobasidium pullulans]|nr:unnamed protein product [Aureobasidium pullulans]
MKLFTALTLIYATLAAAAPSHLLLRDNKPPPPMMPVYISGLPSDNDESNMKCENKYPHRWQNARDDTIVPLPLFRMSGICSPPGGGYFFEYPIIEDGFYAGEDDTLLFRAVFMITDTDPYELQVNYCGTIWRNKKANGGYLSCDLEDFFAHMPREEANIESCLGS